MGYPTTARTPGATYRPTIVTFNEKRGGWDEVDYIEPPQLSLLDIVLIIGVLASTWWIVTHVQPWLR